MINQRQPVGEVPCVGHHCRALEPYAQTAKGLGVDGTDVGEEQERACGARVQAHCHNAHNQRGRAEQHMNERRIGHAGPLIPHPSPHHTGCHHHRGALEEFARPRRLRRS